MINETVAYFIRPIECTGKTYRLVSLLIDGNYIWHQETGTQEEMIKLVLHKNRELIKEQV